MNVGKQFETDFKNSMPSNVWCYRFRDGTASWGQNNSNIRFQQTNICDFVVYSQKLFLLELKTTKGKSLPYSNIKSQRIKQSKLKQQIEMLEEAAEYTGIIPGLVINFRDLEETYFIHIDFITDHIDNEARRSFSRDWCVLYGYKIHQKKKISRYSYDLSTLFNQF